MGNSRGIKRDFKALERRRFEALKLLKKGYNQSEVGRRTKVCSQTVSRWARMVAEEGDRALEAVGRAGRKALLEEKQRKQLVARLLLYVGEASFTRSGAGGAAQEARLASAAQASPAAAGHAAAYRLQQA